MLLRGTWLLFNLVNRSLDQLAMPVAVQAFTDNPAHRPADDVRHLDPNRLDRPLALSIDVPTGRLDDATGFFPRPLLRLLLDAFSRPVGLFDDLPRLDARLLDLVLGALQLRFRLLARFLRLLELLLDL